MLLYTTELKSWNYIVHFNIGETFILYLYICFGDHNDQFELL